MAIPLTGTVSIGNIRTETLTTSESLYSLKQAENQAYFILNSCSPYLPSSSNPASLSEWRGYDHWKGCTCSTYGPASFSPNAVGGDWVLNLSLTAPNGGFLSVSLTGMNRSVTDIGYDNDVSLWLGPTYSIPYVTNVGSTGCVTGTPDGSYNPMRIPGGVTFPADRSFNIAIPAGTTAAQLRISQDSELGQLSGNVSISGCGSTSACTGGVSFYIGNKGRANFSDVSFGATGTFDLYQYKANSNSGMKFSVRDSSGATSTDIGYLACGTTATGVTANYVSSAFSVVEYLGEGGTAIGNWSILKIGGCPTPTEWNVNWAFDYSLNYSSAAGTFRPGLNYESAQVVGAGFGNPFGSYTTPAAATNLGEISIEVQTGGIYLCNASITASDDAGIFCSMSDGGGTSVFLSCSTTTTSANNCLIEGSMADY